MSSAVMDNLGLRKVVRLRLEKREKWKVQRFRARNKVERAKLNNICNVDHAMWKGKKARA